MKLSFFARKPEPPKPDVPKGEYDPVPKALAAIFLGANMLVEMGMTPADGLAFHDGLGRGLARFYRTTDHTEVETATLAAALKIYCSPFAVQSFAEEAGVLSDAGIVPVFDVYQVACDTFATKPECNPFFGPAAILWNAGIDRVPQDTEAVQSAMQALSERIMR